MSATRLLKDSLLMIKSQERKLLTVFAPVYLLWKALEFVFLRSADVGGTSDGVGALAAAPYIASLAILSCNIVLGIALAVMWHRSVLNLEDIRPRRAFFVGYLVQSLWLGLILVLFLIVPIVAVSFLVVAGVSFSPIVIIVAFIVQWIAIRISLVLPDAATLQRGMTLRKSFDLTAPRNTEILVAVAVMFAVQTCVELIGSPDQSQTVPTIVQYLIQIALFPISALIGLSVLTQLYKDEVLAEANA
ncbi:hypothetical protein [Planktotalea sp.]|uniref:hypothetical protein n=1 Tax=Planktotalea sp. TaxID=2029877 RepID=UPI00329A6CB7